MNIGEILTLPEVHISDLTQLQWSVENWQIELGKCAVNTSEAYCLFDEAIERGMDAEERKMLTATLDLCDEAQEMAYRELDSAKAILLERWN